MNYYPIPGANINNTYFYANTSLQLGNYTKPVNSKRVVSVDYSQLIPAVTVSKYSFTIDQGGAPPLVIDDTKLTTNVLSFSIAKGVPDITYIIGIIAWYIDISGVAQKRTDYLNLTIPYEEDGCGCAVIPSTQPNLAPFLNPNNVLFANDVPRYFVSSTTPQGPNLLDVWYNPATGLYQEYVSNGNISFWQNMGGFTGPPGVTPSGTLYNEQLTVTTTNTLSKLLHNSDGNIGILFVNGQAFLSPDVTFSGNTVIWNTGTYAVTTYDRVFAFYSYSS